MRNQQFYVPGTRPMKGLLIPDLRWPAVYSSSGLCHGQSNDPLTHVHIYNKRQYYSKLGWLTDRNLTTCMDFPKADHQVILEIEPVEISFGFDIVMMATQNKCTPQTVLALMGYGNSKNVDVCKSYASVFVSQGLWSCKFRCPYSVNQVAVPYIHFFGTPISVCEIKTT